MNKKLIVLIVALECVLAVFLISFFGPMIASLHESIPVSAIYLLDENGERLLPKEDEDMPSVAISLPGVIDYHFGLEVLEEIVPISARLIANKASYKFKTEAIEKIVNCLERGK